MENMEVEVGETKHFLTGKNILLTGGCGLVGSHLAKKLVNHRTKVIIPLRSADPDSYFFSEKLEKKCTLVNADIKDFSKIFEIVTKYEIDFIFHLAAQAIVDTAYYNPLETFHTNIIGTANVLEAGRLYPKIRGIIVASSDKAYGKKGEKYKEDDPLRGDHPYEASKSSADLITQTYIKTYNAPAVITRFGNIYGEGDLNLSRIIPGILKSIIRNEVLEIRSDGKYIRDYLYVDDVAEGYMILANNIQKTKGEAFNFGSDDTFSVIELIKVIENALNKKVRYKILDSAKNEIPYQSLNWNKVKKIGWKPKSNVEQNILKIYSWYNKII